MNINGFDFINCILDGIFIESNIVNSKISNSQLSKCIVSGTEINSSKILNSSVDNSEVIDCFFMGGYFSGKMIKGVLKSCNLGPYADISSTTKIVTDKNNFFDTKFGESNKKDKNFLLK